MSLQEVVWDEGERCTFLDLLAPLPLLLSTSVIETQTAAQTSPAGGDKGPQAEAMAEPESEGAMPELSDSQSGSPKPADGHRKSDQSGLESPARRPSGATPSAASVTASSNDADALPSAGPETRAVAAVVTALAPVAFWSWCAPGDDAGAPGPAACLTPPAVVDDVSAGALPADAGADSSSSSTSLKIRLPRTRGAPEPVDVRDTTPKCPANDPDQGHPACNGVAQATSVSPVVGSSPATPRMASGSDPHIRRDSCLDPPDPEPAIPDPNSNADQQGRPCAPARGGAPAPSTTPDRSPRRNRNPVRATCRSLTLSPGLTTAPQPSPSGVSSGGPQSSLSNGPSASNLATAESTRKRLRTARASPEGGEAPDRGIPRARAAEAERGPGHPESVALGPAAKRRCAGSPTPHTPAAGPPVPRSTSSPKTGSRVATGGAQPCKGRRILTVNSHQEDRACDFTGGSAASSHRVRLGIKVEAGAARQGQCGKRSRAHADPGADPIKFRAREGERLAVRNGDVSSSGPTDVERDSASDSSPATARGVDPDEGTAELSSARHDPSGKNVKTVKYVMPVSRRTRHSLAVSQVLL